MRILYKRIWKNEYKLFLKYQNKSVFYNFGLEKLNHKEMIYFVLN